MYRCVLKRGERAGNNYIHNHLCGFAFIFIYTSTPSQPNLSAPGNSHTKGQRRGHKVACTGSHIAEKNVNVF